MNETQSNPAQRLRHAMGEIVVGNSQALDAITIAAFTGGHILLEGVPGTAKTLLARLFARCIAAVATRVQFTPDLTPTDLLGTTVFTPGDGSFYLRRGPVFTDILIADEVNRTPPKTQSALLEVMEERAATIDGTREALSPIFMVCATQNPIDFEGTYPLPEAQLDRFLVRVRTGYPAPDEERVLLERFTQGFDGRDLTESLAVPVLQVEELLAARRVVLSVHCSGALQEYLHAIILATRTQADLALGVSPRGLLALLRATQGMAYLRGRDFAIPDDVKDVALFVLPHRVIVRADAELDDVSADQIISRILETVPVPLDPAR